MNRTQRAAVSRPLCAYRDVEGALGRVAPSRSCCDALDIRGYEVTSSGEQRSLRLSARPTGGGAAGTEVPCAAQHGDQRIRWAALPAAGELQPMVGILDSAPARMPVGQREVTLHAEKPEGRLFD